MKLMDHLDNMRLVMLMRTLQAYVTAEGPAPAAPQNLAH
jgi:hypothetical protein